MDRWIVYGKVDGAQLFTAKELTVEPGANCTIKDNGAYGLITVQGIGQDEPAQPLDCPKLIRFHELTEDEVLLHRRRAPKPASPSRTPARLSRWCACATSAPR